MSEESNTKKPTLEEYRAFLSHRRAKSGHKAAFAGAVLCAVGVVSAMNVDDAKVSVDYREKDVYAGQVIQTGEIVDEHGLASSALVALSTFSIIGAFGFAGRAGDRYVRAAGHRNGSKDHLYNPDNYER